MPWLAATPPFPRSGRQSRLSAAFRGCSPGGIRSKQAARRNASLRIKNIESGAAPVKEPISHQIHRRLAQRRVSVIGRPAKAVAAHLPPVDALKPRLVIERLEQRFITSHLVIEIYFARWLGPWLAIRAVHTRITGLREYYWLVEPLLHRFHFANDLGGIQRVRQRTVIFKADLGQLVPQPLGL